MANLGDLIVRVGANIDNFEKSMGTVSQRLTAIDRQASRAFSGFDRIGSRLTDVGTTLTASVTAPMAGLAASALSVAGNFEVAQAKIKAFGDISDSSLEKLRKQAIKLGTDTQFSAQQAADGMAAFASAGLNAEQIYAAMPGTLQLAAAGQIAVGEAANLVSDILGEFGLKAEETGRIADVMSQALKDTKATMGDLGTTLTYVGPVARGANQSLEETVATIIALDQAGIRGEKAGTGLRGVIASLVSPSTEASKIMAQLGISVSDAGGKMLPISAIMDQFKVKLGGVASETERHNMIFQVFGREAGNAAQVLISAGAPALDAYEKKLLASHGAAETLAKTLNSGLNFQMDQFKGAVETAGIALGTTLIPAANRVLALLTQVVTNAVIPAVEWFSKLSPTTQDIALGFAAVAAAAGPLLIGLGLTVSAIGSVGTAITSAAGVLTHFGAIVFPAVIAAVRTFAVSTIPAAASAVAAFATTTLPALILQVGLLAEIMLRQAVVSVTTFATTAIPAAIAALTTFATVAIPAAVGAMVTFATTSVPAAVSSLTTLAVTTIPAAISAFYSFVTAGIGSAITAMGTMASASVPYLIASLSALGVAALAAAAAFAGWQLGSWAYEQIPGVKALGDSAADLILSIPGAEWAMNKLTGATAAQDHATKDLEFATNKLEASLRAKGITVDRGGLSLEEYRKKLAAAGKESGLLGNAQDAFRAQVEEAKKQIIEAEKRAKVYEQAQKELGKTTKQTAEEHKRATTLIKQFQDGIPAEIIRRYESNLREAKKAVAENTLAQQMGARQGEIYGEALERLIEEAGRLSSSANKLALKDIPDITSAMGMGVEKADAFGAAMKHLGITSTSSMKTVADEAAKARDVVLGSGIATDFERNTAIYKALKAQVEYAKAAGIEISAEQKKLLADLEDKLGEKTGQMSKTWKDLGKDVSTIFSNTAQDIAKSFFDGDLSVGEKFKSMAKSMGEAVIAKFIEPATKAIGDFIGGVISDLLSGKGLGGVIDSLKDIGAGMAKIFGAGADAAAGATSAAGQAAGAATGASTAATAASGALGWVSAIGSIGSMVSGIIGNFQNARQENTLNAIEESTRYVKIWTGEQSQNMLWCLQTMTERSGYMTATLDSIAGFASEQLAWLQRIGPAVEEMAAQVAAAPRVSISVTGNTFADRSDVDYILGQIDRRLAEAGLLI